MSAPATSRGDTPASAGDERSQRALLSLEGLSVGDAFGQCFFFQKYETVRGWIDGRVLPPTPWRFSDDTAMARSIVRCLRTHAGIDRDWLAAAFAAEYAREPDRGYGTAAKQILKNIGQGMEWREAALGVFNGEGSKGNGAAMRAGPIGAYFAGDVKTVVSHAHASAMVTHAHPEGRGGAIAVALAASWMVTHFDPAKAPNHDMLQFVIENMPRTESRLGLSRALRLTLDFRPQSVAELLGNGEEVLAHDTVPLCLWCVCRRPHDFVESMWSAVSALGDCDTICAIVGSIVALAAGREGIPREWCEAREPLQLDSI